MLKDSILPKKTKIISMIVISFFVIYMCTSSFIQVKAQSTQNYSSGSLASYPGYDNLIQNLKNKYPNWQFKVLHTGLDWNQVIKNETTACHGRNLIYSNKSGGWICSTCGDKHYDNGSWRCASETAVSYYMDPRNWINEDYIFQFENLSFDENTQNIDGVNKIISGASWMQGNSITYTRTDGSRATINKSYAQLIMEASREANISAYHLAARIVQEQGTGSSASATASGTYSGYTGYYNYCNIGATGSSSATVIANGLNYARNRGWSDPETSIKQSAAYIARNYISVGQSTLYLQKFDVDSSDGSLYNHQYMQNVSAAVSEGTSVKSSYSKLGILNSNFTFVIPVFENMPSSPCASPDNASIVNQNVEVTGDDVQVRSSGSLFGSVLTRVNKGDVLLRIECATGQNNGYYWDKVVLPSGLKGYIARNYLKEIATPDNCNISAVTNTDVNLRNGPGTVGTSIITTLINGQNVTIVEKGSYNNINGYNWVKVKLSNGTQGYIADQYLTIVSDNGANSNNNQQTNYMIATIKCDDGSCVRLRSAATTSSSIVTELGKGTTVTVMQENVANANGYTWDKIVTSEGLEGYIANNYLIKQAQNNGGMNSNENYVLGDCTGDNVINSGDLLALKKHLIGTSVISDENRKKAMDVNKDGNVNSGDLLLVKKHLLGTYKIQ